MHLLSKGWWKDNPSCCNTCGWMCSCRKVTRYKRFQAKDPETVHYQGTGQTQKASGSVVHLRIRCSRPFPQVGNGRFCLVYVWRIQGTFQLVSQNGHNASITRSMSKKEQWRSHFTQQILFHGWEDSLFCKEGITHLCQCMPQAVSASWQSWQESLVHCGKITLFPHKWPWEPENKNEGTLLTKKCSIVTKKRQYTAGQKP